MPELPDVEIYRRYLDATALRQTIDRVEVESPSVLENTNPQALGRNLKGKTFASTRRHGKYLFAKIDGGGWLTMHFGMTGKLQYFNGSEAAPAYTRCLFNFDNGFDLAYIAPRKLGRIFSADSVEQFAHDRKLGPDALDLDLDSFRKLAEKSGSGAKSWLMNQSVMAGVGNVYSDETLFQARVHPNTPVKSLDDKTVRELHRAMIRVLKAAIEAEADPTKMPKSFLLPHRKSGEHCPRCGTGLEKIKAAGRSAWLCPHCQR